MIGKIDLSDHKDPKLEAFVAGLCERSGQIRLTELLRERPSKALYYLTNRSGVCLIALYTADLSEQQLRNILTYRLAQYISVSFVDAKKIYELGLDQEPISHSSADEVHIIAVSVETGEILCYLAVKGAISLPLQATLRTRERSLFPVEQLFGWGVYNRLKILPDLPLAKVREVGRFMKNQRRPRYDELVTRAIAEVGAALFNLLIGPLSTDIEACIGDFEEEVAKKHLDFFHVPLIVLHGVVPYAGHGSYLRPHVQSTSVYPFAFLVADLSPARERLQSVEQALALPEKEGLRALLALKDRSSSPHRSSLEPIEGLPPLNEVVLPQERGDMERRREWLDVGDALRTHEPFNSLSCAEAAVLGTFLDRVEVQPGEVIMRQGDVADALYLIEDGEAEILVLKADGTRVSVALVSSGCFFGEIALITKVERTADVIAKTPMRLLKLSKQTYNDYLRHLGDVDNKFARMALEKAQEQLRQLKSS